MEEIIHGDCLEIMKEIPDKSVDMILCDLPYGTTACHWDTVIPFEPLWTQYKRIVKDNAAIVLFGRQPFTCSLIMSNIKMFRYELIWEKEKGTDFANSNIKPINSHENICLFYKNQPTYNKQLIKGKPYYKKCYNNQTKDDINFQGDNSGIYDNRGFRTPTSVIIISRDNITAGKSLHPTQKPVELFKYLIRTYTNEGDLILDNCAGSGTTGVAAKRLGRKFILIEKEEKYVEIIKQRLKAEKTMFDNL